jgi:basic amino acid/polyamine antiporter, APA family
VKDDPQPHLVKALGLKDAVLMLVGGVIGSGIFLTAGQVATSLRRADLFLLIWIAGGIISMLACLAVAELAGMYPEAGGPYVFLREAYGELPAFLYGWMIFAVAQTGTIAALAVGFAEYLGVLFEPLSERGPSLLFQYNALKISFTMPKVVAILAIVLLTAVNVYGVKRGSWLVNLATWLKFAAIGGLVLLGLAFGSGDWHHFRDVTPDSPVGLVASASAIGSALIAVFFAYDGWVYITWVAGEIKNPGRNTPRALVLGLALVAVIYVSVSVVYVYALPVSELMRSNTVVQSASSSLFSPRYGRWMAAVVALSCFGALSAAILCTARIFYAMAIDGYFFKRMARLHPRHNTPAFALKAQGAWAAVLAFIGLYDQLLTYAIFMMILGYVATVGALFVLRKKQPDVERPYRCVGYPVLPAIYLLIACTWVVSTLAQRPLESFGGLLIVLAGVPGYLYWKRRLAGSS